MGDINGSRSESMRIFLGIRLPKKWVMISAETAEKQECPDVVSGNGGVMVEIFWYGHQNLPFEFP
jgi:hypothetical protein